MEKVILSKRIVICYHKSEYHSLTVVKTLDLTIDGNTNIMKNNLPAGIRKTEKTVLFVHCKFLLYYQCKITTVLHRDRILTSYPRIQTELNVCLSICVSFSEETGHCCTILSSNRDVWVTLAPRIVICTTCCYISSLAEPSIFRLLEEESNGALPHPGTHFN
jgi:hypothetical protein